MASYSYVCVPSRRSSTIIKSSYPTDEGVNCPRRSTCRTSEYADERPSSAYYPSTSVSSPVCYVTTSRARELTSTRPSRDSRRPSSSATMATRGSKGTRLDVQIDTPSPCVPPATSHASSPSPNLSSTADSKYTQAYYRGGLREPISKADETIGHRRPLQPTTSNSTSRRIDKTPCAPALLSPLTNGARRVRWADEDKGSITERMAELWRRSEGC